MYKTPIGVNNFFVNIVFFCVGSNRVTSDMFGSIVGSKLKKAGVRAFVYGSMDSPVNAINMDDYIVLIKSKHKNDIIFVIDTMITANNLKKTFSFNKGSIVVAGMSLKREVGDYHITFNIKTKELYHVTKKQITASADKLSAFLIKNYKRILM